MRSLHRAVVAASLVIAAVLAVPLSTAAAPAPPKATADVPDIVWPPPGTEPVNWTSEQLWTRAAELKNHLGAVFPELVPDVEVTEVGTPQSDTGGNFDGQQYMASFVEFVDEAGSTGLAFQVSAPGFVKDPPKSLCGGEEPPLSCEGRKLADGSVVVNVLSALSGKPKWFLATTRHYRVDGSVTMVTSYSYDPIFDGDEGPNRPEVAVGFPALEKLAGDPELGFLP